MENLSESLISLRVISDHMRSKNVNAANISLTRELLVSVRSARSRYVQALEDQRTVKKVIQEDLKRKVADKAENKSDMLMLGRSDDLRRLSKVKK